MKTRHNLTWIWQGILANESISGEIAAPTQNHARYALYKKNIRVISIRKKRISFFQRQNKITASDLILFFRQLATLILAGIPLLQTIQVIGRNLDQQKLKPICTALTEDIQNGMGFGKSLRRFPCYFDPVTCQLIEAGEKSGTLDVMLERVAMHREEIRTLRRKIIQALFYPAITVSIATLITLIMLLFITPRFATLFSDMHSQLPLFTRIVIATGAALRKYFILIVGVFILLTYILLRTRDKPLIRKYIDTIKLRLPLLGPIICKIQHARFSRTLATLFTAGLPLPDALDLLAPTSGNSIYGATIQQLRQEIVTGQQLHRAIQKSRFFPSIVEQMIEIGEESGTLEKMLLKAADFLESEVDHFISLSSQLLEPLIMVILGVLIGALLVAMYLPIFKLGSVI